MPAHLSDPVRAELHGHVAFRVVGSHPRVQRQAGPGLYVEIDRLGGDVLPLASKVSHALGIHTHNPRGFEAASFKAQVNADGVG